MLKRITTHFKQSVILLMFCLLMINSHHGMTVEVDNLNRSAIAVKSQDSDERKQAIEKGLSEILVRMMGTKSHLSHPAIKHLLENATKYVKSTRYFTKSSQNNLPQKYLEITFDESTIEQYLIKESLPIWHRERPILLVWLIENTDNKHQFLADNNQRYTMIKDHFDKKGIQIGLPIAFPLLDPHDREAVALTSEKSMINQAISNASKRYHTDFLLVGYLEKSNADQTNINWYFSDEKNSFSALNNRASPLKDSIDDAISFISEAIGEKFAVIISNNQIESRYILTVSDLNHYTNYIRLEKQLNEITSIKHINLINMSEGTAIFEITSTAPTDQLKKLILLNQHLKPTHNPETYQSMGNTYSLYFSWKP